MYSVKENPNTSKNGKIKENVFIENGTLTITRDEGSLKYKDGRWYVHGVDNLWHYLGIGAVPVYTTDDNGIENVELFNAVFEKTE